MWIRYAPLRHVPKPERSTKRHFVPKGLLVLRTGVAQAPDRFSDMAWPFDPYRIGEGAHQPRLSALTTSQIQPAWSGVKMNWNRISL